MNDTNRLILVLFQRNKPLASSDVYALLEGKLSLVTIKRTLSALHRANYLRRNGEGRSVNYTLSKRGLLLRPFDMQKYLDTPQERRISTKEFNHELFTGDYVSLFEDDMLTTLESATAEFRQKARNNTDVQTKELQRFMIEMSWKSARIEGNTYSLLDTEQLLAHGIVSPKNTQFETQMLLNQKAAFDFVWETKEDWRKPSISYIEKLHALVIEQLGVPKNMRTSIIGITGTDYAPLANKFQLKEALEGLLAYIERAPNTYEKALLLTAGMSYIQPFVDGNKRTARMAANALLLAEGIAPISYRSVDETAYKEALLIFYEQNSIQPFRELFVEQYVYSATHYNIAL